MHHRILYERAGATYSRHRETHQAEHEEERGGRLGHEGLRKPRRHCKLEGVAPSFRPK